MLGLSNIFMQPSYIRSQLLIQFVIYFHANLLFQQPVAYSLCHLFSSTVKSLYLLTCRPLAFFKIMKYCIYFHANQLLQQPFAYSLWHIVSCKPVILSAICLFIFSFFFMQTSYFRSQLLILFVIYSLANLLFQKPVAYSTCRLFPCKPVTPVTSAANCLYGFSYTCILHALTSYFSSQLLIQFNLLYISMQFVIYFHVSGNQLLTWFVIYFHANQLFQKPVAYSVCHLFSCKPVISADSCLYNLLCGNQLFQLPIVYSVCYLCSCKPDISAACCLSNLSSCMYLFIF